ncbi:hypothetical protein AQ915_01255 [Burkholderia pseudomallei]|nr:hypothetical protein AQ915_01255 [Burkholderia pseudomallei]
MRAMHRQSSLEPWRPACSARAFGSFRRARRARRARQRRAKKPARGRRSGGKGAGHARHARHARHAPAARTGRHCGFGSPSIFMPGFTPFAANQPLLISSA